LDALHHFSYGNSQNNYSTNIFETGYNKYNREIRWPEITVAEESNFVASESSPGRPQTPNSAKQNFVSNPGRDQF
jgi:hypothetical protein